MNMSTKDPTLEEVIHRLNYRVSELSSEMLTFFREIVAIPSMDSDIGPVGQRIGQEMTKLGFDQVYTDRYGSIVGRIGDGPRILLFDSHIDTVGIGERDAWQWDPFVGKVEDGNLYARGALDEKGSTPGMVYGMALARELGLLDGYTLYYLGNIEECCDGVGATPSSNGKECGPISSSLVSPPICRYIAVTKGAWNWKYAVVVSAPMPPATIWAITPSTR